LKEMLTRGVLNDGKQISYALGLEIVSYRGLPTVEHGGALFGYRTEMLRFPAQRFTVLCLCNLSSADPSGLASKVADIYLEKSLQPAAAPAKHEGAGVLSNPTPFAGEYLSASGYINVLSASSDGSLKLNGTVVRATGPNTFESPSGLTISFDSSNGMKVSIQRGDETLFAGSRFERVQLSDANLTEYVGTFRSKELDTTYKLSVENGKLMLACNWNPALKLDPVVRDEFQIDNFGTIVFRRDAKGQISGLSVFDGRIRNIGFDKNN
jgi:hypothetical protein